MPQKKKSKTKKQMKKSINSLWKSLQTEKTKHSKASSIVGHMKTNITTAHKAIRFLAQQNRNLKDEINTMHDREEHASEVMAGLVKNMK